MKPRNFTSGLALVLTTMAVTYVGTSLGETSDHRSQLLPAATVSVFTPSLMIDV